MTWTAEKYFDKAALYWSRATSLERDQPEFLLYVTFTLELMVRGGLCHTHPSLNAAADTESLLHANGLAPRTPAKTIALTEAMARLRRFIPEIAQEDADAIDVLIEARNAELHDDADALEEVKADRVMPHVYSTFTKIAKKAGIELADILGKEDAEHASKVAAASANDRKRRVADLIRIHKDRFYGLPENEQTRLRKEAEPQFEAAITKEDLHLRKKLCPSCKGNGVMVGSPVGKSAPILKEGQIIQEIRVSPTQFSCKSCDLTIKGLDELMAAGFPHEIKAIAEVDPVEHLHIDPMDYVDVHEIVNDYLKEEESTPTSERVPSRATNNNEDRLPSTVCQHASCRSAWREIWARARSASLRRRVGRRGCGWSSAASAMRRWRRRSMRPQASPCRFDQGALRQI